MPIEQGASAVAEADAPPRPPVTTAIRRGLVRRCPNCGVGPSMRGYLKVRDNCSHCGEALGHIRADDFPPYVTIFLVGHIIVPLVLWVEQTYAPPVALQMALWPTLALALAAATLPHVKGAIVGLMWFLRIRGDER